MDDRIAAVLAETFPDRAVDAVADAGPSWNDLNRTVRVNFADGESVYLKVAVDGEGTRVARERAVIAYVAANCDVPVPEVLSSDAAADVPYLATAPMAGESLVYPWSRGDEDRRADLCRAVGRALAGVHAERFDAHGHVTGGGANGLELERGHWTDVLVDRIDELRTIAGPGRFDHHFDRVVDAVRANRSLLDRAPVSLVHGDPAGPNCILAAGDVGLVDWEIAHVGDPAREICRARRQLIEPLHHEGSPRLVRALHEGYRRRAGGLPAGFEERRPVYDAVTFLITSTFFETWAPDADEPTEDLAEWVAAEMDRRLAEV